MKLICYLHIPPSPRLTQSELQATSFKHDLKRTYKQALLITHTKFHHGWLTRNRNSPQQNNAPRLSSYLSNQLHAAASFWKVDTWSVAQEITRFYGTRKFTIVFTKALHWTLNGAS
jgi:hypothetical protein